MRDEVVGTDDPQSADPEGVSGHDGTPVEGWMYYAAQRVFSFIDTT